MAESLCIPFIETSAKTSAGVEQAFMKMAKDITTRMAAQPPSMAMPATTVLNSDFSTLQMVTVGIRMQ